MISRARLWSGSGGTVVVVVVPGGCVDVAPGVVVVDGEVTGVVVAGRGAVDVVGDGAVDPSVVVDPVASEHAAAPTAITTSSVATRIFDECARAVIRRSGYGAVASMSGVAAQRRAGEDPAVPVIPVRYRWWSAAQSGRGQKGRR